ncbi:MAG: hypothetical protein HY868_08070 [Chloroflexi bacterium]|nr:hypothetical protein [Chloroflexota bacterium]
MARFPFQLLVVIAITLGVFFAWDLSQRIISGARLNDVQTQAEVQRAHAQATQVALVALKTRIATNEFVEDKARREWGWSRDGETVVQAIVTPAPTPTPTPPPFPTPTPEPSLLETILRFLIP